jgi:hypothetical protein
LSAAGKAEEYLDILRKFSQGQPLQPDDNPLPEQFGYL